MVRGSEHGRADATAEQELSSGLRTSVRSRRRDGDASHSCSPRILLSSRLGTAPRSLLPPNPPSFARAQIWEEKGEDDERFSVRSSVITATLGERGRRDDVRRLGAPAGPPPPLRTAARAAAGRGGARRCTWRRPRRERVRRRPHRSDSVHQKEPTDGGAPLSGARRAAASGVERRPSERAFPLLRSNEASLREQGRDDDDAGWRQRGERRCGGGGERDGRAAAAQAASFPPRST